MSWLLLSCLRHPSQGSCCLTSWKIFFKTCEITDFRVKKNNHMLAISQPNNKMFRTDRLTFHPSSSQAIRTGDYISS